MTLAKLPDWAGEMVDRERVARLALLDADDLPRVLPVTFAAVRFKLAAEAIFTVIDDKPKRAREPARVRWLRRRPEAALCIDVYDDDWRRLAWVQVIGRVDVLDVGEDAAGMVALAAKYPQYAERVPPGPLLRLRPERALHWRAADGEAGR